jgi:hypothetical protein
MNHFLLLSEDEKMQAVLRLAKSGMSDYSIATAAGVSVEQIRLTLGQRGQCEACDE